MTKVIPVETFIILFLTMDSVKIYPEKKKKENNEKYFKWSSLFFFIFYFLNFILFLNFT